MDVLRINRFQKILLVIVFSLNTPFMIKSAQSALDSLDIYDPFNSIDRIRVIINENYSMLSEEASKEIDEYNTEIEDAEKRNDTLHVGELAVEIGNVYFESAVFTLAFKYYYLALSNYESINDTLNAALVKVKLGRTYFFADLDTYKDFYQSAYSVLGRYDRQDILAVANYIGGLIENDDNKKRIYFKKALDIQKEVIEQYPDKIETREMYAIILNANNQYKTAISIAKEINNHFLLVLFMNNLGHQKVLERKYDEGLQIFRSSVEICKKEKLKALARNAYENISRVYRFRGEWEKAAKYKQLVRYFEESLHTETNRLEVAEMEVKYESEKKEIENAFLKKEKDILAGNISIHKMLIIFLLISTLSISVILILIYKGKKKLSDANQMLDHQNAEILSQKSKLEKLNLELQKSENLLNEAQATANLANWETFIPSNAIRFSENFLKIFGTSLNKVYNNFNAVIDEVVLGQDSKIINSFFFDYESENVVNEIEFQILSGESLKWIKAKRVVEIDDRENVVRVFGTVQDISDLKEKEKIKLKIAEQKSFTKELIQFQEEERKRIAGELHDGLGQELLIVKNKVLLCMQKKKFKDSGLCEYCEIDSSTCQLCEMDDAISSMLDLVREISFNLRPAHLERIGLTETIKSTFKSIEDAGLLRIEHYIEDIDGLMVADNEMNFFRIIQEGINNIIKHAFSKKSYIEITHDCDTIKLVVEDFGVGFDFNSEINKSGGYGLKNIYNRVLILNGKIDVKSISEKGTRMEIIIPVETNE